MNPIQQAFAAEAVREYTHSTKYQRRIIENTKLPCGKDNKPRNIPARIATELLEGDFVKIGEKLYHFNPLENKVEEVYYG